MARKVGKGTTLWMLIGAIAVVLILMPAPVLGGECNYKQCLDKNPTNFSACACCIVNEGGNIDDLCGPISSCDKPIGILINKSDISLNGEGVTVGSPGIKPGCCGIGILIGTMYERFSKVSITNVSITGWTNGVLFWDSDNGKLKNSSIFGNDNGITIFNTNDTVIQSNYIYDNPTAGLNIESNPVARNNWIYDNYFKNKNNVYLSHSFWFNSWNVTKTSGLNIIGGQYLGGNYWADPSGTGFSETCICNVPTQFCTLPYTIKGTENIDKLPLCYPPTIEITVTGGIYDWKLPVGTSENTEGIDLQVETNAHTWSVSVRDLDTGKPEGSEGKLTEYDLPESMYGTKMLQYPMNVSAGNGYVVLSYNEAPIITSTSPGIFTYDIGIQQTVEYGDSVLESGSIYRTVIIFEATALG
jgi:parallel beta-helix repeat protein